MNAGTLIPMAEGAATNKFDVDHDIWFHIALRLDPEDVQTFALVCTQFAKLVSSRVFWRNMFKRHCLSGSSTKAWNLELPAQLQLEQINNCDKKALRSRVIEALFHCYRPLKTRLELGYNLDWLLQRTFVTCTQKQYQYLWIICYTLWNQQTSQLPSSICEDQVVPTEMVNDWESLADDDTPAMVTSTSRHEGVALLIVLCQKFMPLPMQLLYNQQQTRFRLKATREMLCTDMCAKNLELDFVEDNTNSQQAVTVKYSRIQKYKVLPWWHPDFKRFVK